MDIEQERNFLKKKQKETGFASEQQKKQTNGIECSINLRGSFSVVKIKVIKIILVLFKNNFKLSVQNIVYIL